MSRLHALWDQALEAEVWSEGPLTDGFESAWSAWNGLPAVATSNWTGAALVALEFAHVRGRKVLCPSNSFMAVPRAIEAVGGQVEFVDCNREDLCMSFEDFEAQALRHEPAAAVLVHIGGHLAFQVGEIAAFCRSHGIFLIEDCAHAHGAAWDGRRAGSWGDAGVWSFGATKTISTGEGGMLVSKRDELIEFARRFRNYGKPDYALASLNYRMNEFTAAVGIVATERLEEIVAWKNVVAREQLDPVYSKRVRLPEGMTSGYYKYVVFEPIARSTGKVYEAPCHRIMERQAHLPNSDWVAENHWCVPLYYRPDTGKQGQAMGAVAS